MLSRILMWIPVFRDLYYAAYHDALTGARNRHWLRKYGRAFQAGFVWFIDINGLHEVNQKGGHAAGDKLIKEVSDTLRATPGVLEVIRYGGDEFIAFTESTKIFITDKAFTAAYEQISYAGLEYAIRGANVAMLAKKGLNLTNV